MQTPCKRLLTIKFSCECGLMKYKEWLTWGDRPPADETLGEIETQESSSFICCVVASSSRTQHPNLRADYFPWRMGSVSDEAWRPGQ